MKNRFQHNSKIVDYRIEYMQKMKWSDFEWFKKNAKVQINDYFFKCSEKIGLDQKLIFPIRNQSKYLTFSNSKKYTDLHMSYEDKSIPKRSIFQFRFNKTKNIIKKQMRIKKLCKFVPYSNKDIGKWILVDPYSRKFLSKIHTMRELNILPHYLLKLRIASMRNNHNKVLLAYDVFGRFIGLAKCNHRKQGFHFIPHSVLEDIQGKLVDFKQVQKILKEENLEENNKKLQTMWDGWKYVMRLFQKIHIVNF